MRFILALVSLVIAVVLIGLGIAQRTVLAGPDSLTASSVADTGAPVTILDGETLNAMPGLQEIRASGAEPVFAAYGRTTDIMAWVGDTARTELGFDADTRELTARTIPGADDTVPSPVGSDLWLKEYTSETDLRMLVKLDPNLSVILVSDGTAPAPTDVSVTWPIDNRTPWALPLVAAGAAILLLALIFFFWALLHQRRMRGPRRSSIKAVRGSRMPKLPRQRSYRVRKPKQVTRGKGRRSTRRMTAILPVALVSLLALTGCSMDLLALQDEPDASASPSASVQADDDATAAAATVGQVRAIIGDVAEVAEAADAALDPDALEERFTGPALEVRQVNYAVRAKDSAYAAPAPIPTTSLEVTLPQVTGETWPRSLFTVVTASDDDATAPVALTLVQETPRAKYKVMYAVTLEPDAILPDLAPEGIGSLPLGPESPLLSTPPSAVLPAYIDVLNTGEASDSYDLFDITRDSLIPQLAKIREDQKAQLGADATIEVANAPGEADSIALSSNETGALVNVYLTATTTVKPVEAGSKISPEGAVKTLSGLTDTTKGFTSAYGDQLLFYIPPIGSTDKIVLLGFSEGLVSAQELP